MAIGGGGGGGIKVPLLLTAVEFCCICPETSSILKFEYCMTYIQHTLYRIPYVLIMPYICCVPYISLCM